VDGDGELVSFDYDYGNLNLYFVVFGRIQIVSTEGTNDCEFPGTIHVGERFVRIDFMQKIHLLTVHSCKFKKRNKIQTKFCLSIQITAQ